jgi:hypothetical protein
VATNMSLRGVKQRSNLAGWLSFSSARSNGTDIHLHPRSLRQPSCSVEAPSIPYARTGIVAAGTATLHTTICHCVLLWQRGNLAVPALRSGECMVQLRLHYATRSGPPGRLTRPPPD